MSPSVADRTRYEVQRLIPPTLGGTDDPANLFPVLIATSPGAADKHDIDDLLTADVCAGSLDLETARNALVVNWPIAYSSTRFTEPGD